VFFYIIIVAYCWNLRSRFHPSFHHWYSG
jgi:hypothetical protein